MLVHIDPRYLDIVWLKVSDLLAAAIEKGRGEMTLDQLKLLIRQGSTQLVVWTVDDEVISAGAIDFINYPNYRVAHCSYLSGRYTAESFNALMQWCRDAGAQHIQCFGDDAIARLYRRYGFHKCYNILRIAL